MQPLVSCVVITYNSQKFFETFFSTLLSQKDALIELIFIDNASADESFESAQKLLATCDFFEKVTWIKNTENLGYSGAAEQGVKAARGKYILIANPDIVFEPDYVSRLVEAMELDKNIGAITGKLRKFDFAKYFQVRAEGGRESHNLAAGKTDLIDSAGLMMYKSRRCVDRGQGSKDEGQFDTTEEVFGITGAAPFYRRAALHDIELEGITFEPDFFMYKEDVDVSWRLRLMGWSCVYLPSAVAYHGRGTGAVERESIGSVIQGRSVLPRFTKHHSYRNERVMRLRNEFVTETIRHLPSIVWRELLMLGWMCIREPYLFKSLLQVAKKIPATLKKRNLFMRRIKVTAHQMRRWFV